MDELLTTSEFMFNDPFVADWHNQTTLHPLGAAAALVLGGAMMLVPRRFAIVPLLIMACFVSPAQRVVFATLDFSLLRVMVVFGATRLLLRGELSLGRWRAVDMLVAAWAVASLTAMSLQYASIEVLVQKLGFTFDTAGMYFLCRMLVRSWRDVETIARSAAVLCVPVAAAFVVEHATGRNLFAFLGGVPEVTGVREGRLRCQGAFAHPILAGCFWVSLLPLMTALWFRGGRDRFVAVAGAIGALIIVYACASSTPVSVLIVVGVAVAAYPLRSWLYWLRWLAPLALVGLHLAMIRPVWHLLARIDFVSGSTGWYRYRLIDEFLRRTDEWWLLGTHQYVQWYEHQFRALTNHYVVEGVNGGLLTLALFVAVIAAGFCGTGRTLRLPGLSPARRMLAWGLGAALLAHATAFLGVAYVGQINVVWFMTLAMIGSLQQPVNPRAATLRVRRGRATALANPSSRPALA